VEPGWREMLNTVQRDLVEDRMTLKQYVVDRANSVGLGEVATCIGAAAQLEAHTESSTIAVKGSVAETGIERSVGQVVAVKHTAVVKVVGRDTATVAVEPSTALQTGVRHNAAGPGGWGYIATDATRASTPAHASEAEHVLEAPRVHLLLV